MPSSVGSVSVAIQDDFASKPFPKEWEVDGKTTINECAAANQKRLADVGITEPRMLLGKYLMLGSNRPAFEKWLLEEAKVGDTTVGGNGEGKRNEKYAALMEAWVSANM